MNFNKKSIIQIIIIVGCLGGSVLVIYNGLFKSNSASSPSSGALFANSPGQTQSAAAQNKILPYGDRIDFGILKKNGLQFGKQAYPRLNFDAEVGIGDESNLIKTASPSKAQ